MFHNFAAHYPGFQNGAARNNANGNQAALPNAHVAGNARGPAALRQNQQPLQHMPALGDDPRRLEQEYRRLLEIEFFGPNEPAQHHGQGHGFGGNNQQYEAAFDFGGVPHAGPFQPAGVHGHAFHGHAFDIPGPRGPVENPQPQVFNGREVREVREVRQVREAHEPQGAQLPPFRLDGGAGGAGAAQPPAQGAAQPPVQAPRRAPVGARIVDELDRTQANDPVVVHTIDISFPAVDDDGCIFKQVLSVPEDRDPLSIRRDVCRRMGLDPEAARLGFKTSRDKAKELPRGFNSREDIQSAIEHINQLKKSARSKPVEMEIIDLKAPSADGHDKKTKKSSKKRRAQSTVDDDSADDIDKHSPQLKLLRASLLCANKSCPTPGEANRNKYCRVLPDGTHEWVMPAEMAHWAWQMVLDPENVNPKCPPPVRVYDAKPKKTRAPKANNMPNINIHISKDLLASPPTKRQRTVKDEDTDSPPRRVKKEDPGSPPRRVKKEDPGSPPHRVKKEGAGSPPRRVKAPEIIDLTLSDDIEIIEVPVKLVKVE
ncbi:hypothetical protein AURDEDRAFT_164396 [Auricularia subglabra TFB-10046 SS5]|nr:hypothetical protein AURDEDRAFT_164396 [Auricularia subglabra TFB-10046 SS5]